MSDQASQPAADARRPAMMVRVAVTGAIAMPLPGAAAHARIRADIGEALAVVRTELVAAQADPRARACHAEVPAVLRCLSQLAEGADRLFADVALEQVQTARDQGLGLALDVVLPFDADDYRTTFHKTDGVVDPASIAAFDALLAQADRVLTLDGDVASDLLRPRSYEAAGRVMVRNADLVVAVWDDTTTPKGRGGTRDTIEFALRSNVPVWWIDAKGEAPPRLLTDILDLGAPAEQGEPARALGRSLRAILMPPPPEAVHGLRHGYRVDPLFEYLAEPLRMSRDLWRIHPLLIGRLRRCAGGVRLPAAKGTGRTLRSIASLWLARGPFDHARSIPSQLSQAYQYRYRTSYLLVLAAAATALVSATIGLAYREVVGEHAEVLLELVASTIELVALALAAVLVLRNHFGRWHERYIGYRLLGELARPAPLLIRLGLSLPYGQVRRAAGPNPQNWIAWLAAAHARALPLPAGRISAVLPAIRDDLSERMLQGQIDFHERRHRECHGLGRRLGQAAAVLFGATVLAVAVKLALIAAHASAGWLALMSLLIAGLSAASAATFGLKAYEEFELLADLSQALGAELKQRRERIGRIDLTRPLASQALGEEAYEAASVMLSEVGGWAQLFRSRQVEA